MMDFTQRGRKAPSTINTKHILFIVSGAFGGLEKIIRQRLRETGGDETLGGQIVNFIRLDFAD